MPWARLHLRVLVTATLLAAACGGAPEGASTATPETKSAGDTSRKTNGGGAPTGAGQELLAFSAPAIGGGSVKGVEFRGRPTLLWFWSPW